MVTAQYFDSVTKLIIFITVAGLKRRTREENVDDSEGSSATHQPKSIPRPVKIDTRTRLGNQFVYVYNSYDLGTIFSFLVGQSSQDVLFIHRWIGPKKAITFPMHLEMRGSLVAAEYWYSRCSISPDSYATLVDFQAFRRRSNGSSMVIFTYHSEQHRPFDNAFSEALICSPGSNDNAAAMSDAVSHADASTSMSLSKEPIGSLLDLARPPSEPLPSPSPSIFDGLNGDNVLSRDLSISAVPIAVMLPRNYLPKAASGATRSLNSRQTYSTSGLSAEHQDQLSQIYERVKQRSELIYAHSAAQSNALLTSSDSTNKAQFSHSPKADPFPRPPHSVPAPTSAPDLSFPTPSIPNDLEAKHHKPIVKPSQPRNTSVRLMGRVTIQLDADNRITHLETASGPQPSPSRASGAPFRISRSDAN